ncbi:MAG: hypothetical protein ACREPH_12840 [Rhodanobacteraceae bacterium]
MNHMPVFRPFRIHNDDAAYRAGFESMAIATAGLHQSLRQHRKHRPRRR